eukprot:gnl/TRDRNA2_/TRDRNA2_175140_c6_seq8.p1 gnl/TRDRNA2_/TRDRNA2_175140_c6~~gnl/TRDRNA2_/TRDRNA2_175140_c6_seq8.p1  ORF type:complete len:737 (-),score=218.44 gnl/TRDRNA2_/TRDRNA2_175140_c6_seq8:108-2243(-)
MRPVAKESSKQSTGRRGEEQKEDEQKRLDQATDADQQHTEVKDVDEMHAKHKHPADEATGDTELVRRREAEEEATHQIGEATEWGQQKEGESRHRSETEVACRAAEELGQQHCACEPTATDCGTWVASGSWGPSCWGGSGWGGTGWGGSSWGGSMWGGSTWGGSTWGGSNWGGSSWPHASADTWQGSDSTGVRGCERGARCWQSPWQGSQKTWCDVVQTEQEAQKLERRRHEEESERKAIEEAERRRQQEEAEQKEAERKREQEEAERKEAERRRREEEARKAAEEAERRRREQEAARKAAEEAERRRREAEAAQKAADEAERKRLEDEAARKAADDATRQQQDENEETLREEQHPGSWSNGTWAHEYWSSWDGNGDATSSGATGRSATEVGNAAPAEKSWDSWSTQSWSGRWSGGNCNDWSDTAWRSSTPTEHTAHSSSWKPVNWDEPAPAEHFGETEAEVIKSSELQLTEDWGAEPTAVTVSESSAPTQQAELQQEEAERRLCPDDGKEYTLCELQAAFKGVYSDSDLQAYWKDAMRPLSNQQEAQGAKASSPAKDESPHQNEEWYQKWLRRQEHRPRKITYIGGSQEQQEGDQQQPQQPVAEEKPQESREQEQPQEEKKSYEQEEWYQKWLRRQKNKGRQIIEIGANRQQEEVESQQATAHEEEEAREEPVKEEEEPQKQEHPHQQEEWYQKWLRRQANKNRQIIQIG